MVMHHPIALTTVLLNSHVHKPTTAASSNAYTTTTWNKQRSACLHQDTMLTKPHEWSQIPNATANRLSIQIWTLQTLVAHNTKTITTITAMTTALQLLLPWLLVCQLQELWQLWILLWLLIWQLQCLLPLQELLQPSWLLYSNYHGHYDYCHYLYYNFNYSTTSTMAMVPHCTITTAPPTTSVITNSSILHCNIDCWHKTTALHKKI